MTMDKDHLFHSDPANWPKDENGDPVWVDLGPAEDKPARGDLIPGGPDMEQVYQESLDSLKASIEKLRVNAEAGWQASERAWRWFRVMTVIAIVAVLGFMVSVIWMWTFL